MMESIRNLITSAIDTCKAIADSHWIAAIFVWIGVIGLLGLGLAGLIYIAYKLIQLIRELLT